MMDFGPRSEPEEPNRGIPKVKKRIIFYFIGGLVIVFILSVILTSNTGNPLPESIKSQISYKPVYPSSKTGTLDQKGYQYRSGQQTLSFSVNSNKNQISFSEQPAPDNLGAGDQVYFPAIGLHPYAQFQSKLGPVALVRFFQSGNLKPTGQSAVLVSHGTLVIAHSDKNMSNEQWKDLINSLKIAK